MKLRELAWGLAAAVLAPGCGAAATVAPEGKSGAQRARITDERHGYSVALPAGWYRARRNLTPQLTQPREILSVATYPLRYKRRARCRISGCPTPALNGFGPTDILISIQERVHAPTTPQDVAIDLDRRQAHPGAGARSCTRDRVGWYAFEAFAEAGRSLYVLVVVGKRAAASERADLKRLLASLHFSPRRAAAPLPQTAVGQHANPAATGAAADP